MEGLFTKGPYGRWFFNAANSGMVKAQQKVCGSRDSARSMSEVPEWPGVCLRQQAIVSFCSSTSGFVDLHGHGPIVDTALSSE